LIFKDRKGLRKGALWVSDLYEPANGREITEACKPKKNIHHGSKSYFNLKKKNSCIGLPHIKDKFFRYP
jgi:hypothetical protein